MPFPTNLKGTKLLAENGGKNYTFHPWVQYHSLVVVRTMDEAVDIIKRLAS
jgi:hypothetical protein